MMEQKASGMLRFVENGANRPLHQDRQVLRASDLTLEQTTQDEMLARARRHLHGWGVVAGFVPTVTQSQGLEIGPGYGVTPLGDELFLPQPVTLEDAREALIVCCGPGPEGCAQIDPEMIRARRSEAENIAVTGWLIARPARRDALPRAGVPQDCAHPASILLPSRRCGGVAFAVICTLPPAHEPQQPTCEELMPFVCGTEEGSNPPVPWQTPLPADANFLVLAKLQATVEELAASTLGRRTLWPVALMQDWIRFCICPRLAEGARIPISSGGGGATTVAGGGHGDPAGTHPGIFTGGVPEVTIPHGVIDVPPIAVVPPEVPSGPIPPVEIAGIREKLTGPVSDIAGVGAARATALGGIGVNTQGDFITTPTETLATALKLSTAKVTTMKQELNAQHNLGLAFR